MGRVNSHEERLLTLRRIEGWNASISKVMPSLSYSSVSGVFYQELRDYFALCSMARGKTALRGEAEHVLFSTRVVIERWIQRSVKLHIKEQPAAFSQILKQKAFGESKKQGVSLRFALNSCQPTKICSNLCYAHDVLDAAPAAVIRGAINGIIAEFFEAGSAEDRQLILDAWEQHVALAVKAALLERDQSEFPREGRIRFGHVGDGAHYAEFCNAIGRLVVRKSNGQVSPIIYTRHSMAHKLDNEVFVVNFTIDSTSEDRRKYVPIGARTVFSAFGGLTSSAAEVNFLEHHRFSHLPQIGEGHACPATLTETKIRTCDAVKCDLCFERPTSKVPL
jgi:hypothetical protein